jgi:hypothetical protein
MDTDLQLQNKQNHPKITANPPPPHKKPLKINSAVKYWGVSEPPSQYKANF